MKARDHQAGRREPARASRDPLRSIRTVLAAVMVAISPLTAVADEHDEAVADIEGPYFPNRFYLGAGVGVTRLEPESPTDALTVGDEYSTGGNLFLGVDLSRWLSAEFYVADLGEASIDFLGSDVGIVWYQVYETSLIGYLYNTRGGLGIGDTRSGLFRREGLSLYGRAGIGWMENAANLEYRRDHTAHATFGAGLEYGFRNGFALRGEVTGFDVDARYASISVLKRFGDVPQPVARIRQPNVASSPPPAPVAPAAAMPSPDAVSTPAPVLFDFDRAEVKPDARRRLDAFVPRIGDLDATVSLGGHTDAIGSEAYNQGLSLRRANAVRRYLLDQGIDASRITVTGHGETRPVASNDSPEGRARNRRVEIGLERPR